MVRALIIGSWTVFRDALVSVKSVAGESAIPPSGSGRLQSRSANSVASVKLPPAESPAMNVELAAPGPAGPFLISQL